MVAHHARLSKTEAITRHRTSKICVALPLLGAAYSGGTIPVDNMRQLGRLYGNRRIRDKMIDEESWFVEKAVELRPAYFHDKLRVWEDLNDFDGPEPEAERCHRNRRYRFAQQFDKSFMGEHSHGSMQGAEMHKIFQHYYDAETLADWETARAEHGDNATAEQLPRNAQQRAADALHRIYLDAASNPDGPVPTNVIHNIVWNEETFEYFLNLYFGDPQDTMDPDLYLCETIDGIQLNPYETITSALVPRLRRAVVDSSHPAHASGRHATSQPANVKPITSKNTPNTAKPTPPAGQSSAANTTAGNKKASRSGKTQTETGTPTDPTAPKSIPDRFATLAMPMRRVVTN